MAAPADDDDVEGSCKGSKRKGQGKPKGAAKAKASPAKPKASAKAKAKAKASVTTTDERKRESGNSLLATPSKSHRKGDSVGSPLHDVHEEQLTKNGFVDLANFFSSRVAPG